MEESLFTEHSITKTLFLHQLPVFTKKCCSFSPKRHDFSLSIHKLINMEEKGLDFPACRCSSEHQPVRIKPQVRSFLHLIREQCFLFAVSGNTKGYSEIFIQNYASRMYPKSNYFWHVKTKYWEELYLLHLLEHLQSFPFNGPVLK